MSRSEFDANQALLAIADDPLEQTQRMPVADRRYRQNEARQAVVDGIVDEQIDRQRWPDFRDHGRPGTSHDRAQQDGFPDGE